MVNQIPTWMQGLRPWGNSAIPPGAPMGAVGMPDPNQPWWAGSTLIDNAAINNGLPGTPMQNKPMNIPTAPVWTEPATPVAPTPPEPSKPFMNPNDPSDPRNGKYWNYIGGGGWMYGPSVGDEIIAEDYAAKRAEYDARMGDTAQKQTVEKEQRDMATAKEKADYAAKLEADKEKRQQTMKETTYASTADEIMEKTGIGFRQVEAQITGAPPGTTEKKWELTRTPTVEDAKTIAEIAKRRGADPIAILKSMGVDINALRTELSGVPDINKRTQGAQPGAGKTLDRATAQMFMRQANGNANAARELARAAGYIIS